jgi:hypothetical protein
MCLRSTLDEGMQMATGTGSGVQQDVLRSALQAAVDSLHRRRASEIPEGYIDGYVKLNWLEWHGGSLRLTPTGENICKNEPL